MFYYGMAKVIPTQFQAPSLVTLVQPVGTLSLADLLWTFIGASTPYQMAAGLAEVAAGVLLVIPRTAMLGAWVCLFDMTQVFVLNMAYDFGLKQLSLHLILMAAVLVAPDLPRLATLFLRRQALAGPVLEERIPGVRGERGRRVATWIQVLAGVYLLAMFTNLSLRFWSTEGDGRPRSPVYGIWDVAELRMNGDTRGAGGRGLRPALAPGDLRYAGRRGDPAHRRLRGALRRHVRLRRPADAPVEGPKPHVARLLSRSSAWATIELRLSGEMDGHRIDARLRRVELDTFRLRQSPFRWVRPPDPFAG